MFSQKPPLAPEKWAEDVDVSKVQGVTNSNFYVYAGIAAIVFFVLFIIWVVLT
jgi:hypothetical protein